MKRKTIRRRAGRRKQRGGGPIDDYRELLTTYAVNDAIHDFDDYANDNITGLLEGIPEANYTIYTNEKHVLESILIDKINGDITALPFNIETLYMLYNEYEQLVIDLLFNDIVRTYKIKVIPWQIEDDVIVESNELATYFERPRTFIIDHYTLKFFKGLKNGIEADYKDPYYILYNRENENDAAKKGVFDIFTEEGLNVQVSYDTGVDRVVYPLWNEYNSINYNRMFYSNYNLELKYYNNKQCKLIFTNNSNIYTINNTKENNKVTKVIDNTYPLDIKFQQKRSGDALQALSVFDNARTLTDMNAHNNPKMLVTHDRLCLYYSLLMGIDVAFTTIQKEDDKYKVCVLFLNENKIEVSHNFRGGRLIPKNRTRKIKYNMTNSDDHPNHLESYYRLLNKSIDTLTNNEIGHIVMMNIYYKTNNRHIRSDYSSISHKIEYYEKLKIPYDMCSDRVYKIITHYDVVDKPFANYLRSIICLITVLSVYEVDLGESMDTCYENQILKSATPEILEILEQYPPERRASKMWSMLRWDRGKTYPDVYDEVCYCSAWDIEDYARVMLYIMDNRLDVYTTLLELVGPYGVQTTVESLLQFSKVPYTRRRENTPELRALVDRIHKLPKNDNLRGWKYIKGRIEDYLLETFNQRFKWCAPFWESDN